MTGVLLLAPGAVPEGTWLILAGVILLGASAVRLAMHLRVSAFVLALGVLALVAGASAIAGVKMPLLPLFLVVLGGSLMLRAWFARSEA